MNKIDITERIIGMTASEARDHCRAEGYKMRVVSRDGEYFTLTRDYNKKRINVEIVEDIITKSNIG